MQILINALLVAGAFARSTFPGYEFHSEGPTCPIEDPLKQQAPSSINVTFHDILHIELGSEITDFVAEGLSSFRYKLGGNTILLTTAFEVVTPVVNITANYNASGYIDARPFSQETIPSGNFTGSGNGSFRATNVKLQVNATLVPYLLGPYAYLRSLNLNTVSFDSLAIDLGPDFIIAGSSVDWSELSAEIKNNFESEFAANKKEVTSRIRLAANTIIEKYTFGEMVGFIDRIIDWGESEC